MRLPNSILSLFCGSIFILMPSLCFAQGAAGAKSPAPQEQTITSPPPVTGKVVTGKVAQTPAEQATEKKEMKEKKMEVATFGGGCFWCIEAVFLELKGVSSVKSAYMGGQVDNPTYKQVCSGTTGHAEVIHIEYDPEVVSFDVLLQVFWTTHDPTTLNRQGADVGTQYRSVVFYHSDSQRDKATSYKKKLNEVKAFSSPIVTEISAATKLYVAEDYHQNYFNNNPDQPYCRALIPPKLEKLKKAFGDKLKSK